MCLSPQPRAFFEHQHIQKWSKHVMFWRFWLPNVPFATAACIFSTSARTKVGPNTSCFVHFDFQMCFSPQRRAIFRHQHAQKWSKHVMFCAFWLPNVLFATAACNFSTSELPKMACIFFNISTHKSGPNTSCFVHFDFQMCFSPQRRAIFRHQHAQKWSKHVMFCAFWLPNVLFATAACNFSTSELPKMACIFSTSARTKVVQTRHVLCILTSKCAFRHSRVQFFDIRTSKSALGMRHVLCILISKCAFRHSGVQFFDIRTSKSALGMRCFGHFHFQTRLSPQPWAIFKHLDLEKCSRTLSFLTFSLPNVLFATVAYNFATAELTKSGLRTAVF